MGAKRQPSGCRGLGIEEPKPKRMKYLLLQITEMPDPGDIIQKSYEQDPMWGIIIGILFFVIVVQGAWAFKLYSDYKVSQNFVQDKVLPVLIAVEKTLDMVVSLKNRG